MVSGRARARPPARRRGLGLGPGSATGSATGSGSTGSGVRGRPTRRCGSLGRSGSARVRPTRVGSGRSTAGADRLLDRAGHRCGWRGGGGGWPRAAGRATVPAGATWGVDGLDGSDGRRGSTGSTGSTGVDQAGLEPGQPARTLEAVDVSACDGSDFASFLRIEPMTIGSQSAGVPRSGPASAVAAGGRGSAPAEVRRRGDPPADDRVVAPPRSSASRQPAACETEPVRGVGSAPTSVRHGLVGRLVGGLLLVVREPAAEEVIRLDFRGAESQQPCSAKYAGAGARVVALPKVVSGACCRELWPDVF